jgi:hypothetical protein
MREFQIAWHIVVMELSEWNVIVTVLCMFVAYLALSLAVEPLAIMILVSKVLARIQLFPWQPPLVAGVLDWLWSKHMKLEHKIQLEVLHSAASDAELLTAIYHHTGASEDDRALLVEWLRNNGRATEAIRNAVALLLSPEKPDSQFETKEIPSQESHRN